MDLCGVIKPLFMIILDWMWEFSPWCQADLSPALFGPAGQLGSLSRVHAGNPQTFYKHFQGYDVKFSEE